MTDTNQAATEIQQVATELLEAVLDRRAKAVQALLVPGGPAAVGCQLFGLDFLIAQAGLHTPGRELRSRRLEIRKGQARLECICVPKEDSRREEWLFTVYARRLRGKWKIDHIRPIGLEQTLEDVAFDPLLAGLYDGTAQLQLGKEGLDDEVEMLLLQGMRAEPFNYAEQVSAVRLWRDFRRKAKPDITKANYWAAAIEYIVILLEYREGGQKSVARKYGATVGTVSARYRQVCDTLKLRELDPRYSVDENLVDEDALRQIGINPHKIRLPLTQVKGKLPPLF